MDTTVLLLFVERALSLIQILATIPKYDYLAKLALRIPSDNLFRWGRRYRLIVPIIGGITSIIGFGFTLLIRYQRSVPISSVLQRFQPVLYIMDLAGVVLVIMELVFIIIYARSLKGQILISRQIQPQA